MNSTNRIRLAFAAAWSGIREMTWSGTPNSLLTALKQRTDIDCIDAPVHVSKTVLVAARFAYVRRMKRRWLSQYRISPPVVRSEQRGLRAALRNKQADIALIIGDLGVSPIPYMNYFDHTFIHLADDTKHGRDIIEKLRVNTPGLLKRRTMLQIERFQKSSALISMSHWDANVLKAAGVVDPERVFVVPPGRNAFGDRAAFEDRAEHRLLFIGRDFFAKGGEQVVHAFTKFRSNVEYKVSLVVAGPEQWPLREPIPTGVEFLGDISFARVHEEMKRACAFVMPSIWEAYGIVFLEALGEGIPVIGRDVCAMPEFITHGSNGLLLKQDDFGVDSLAEYMHSICTDIEMRKRVHDQANEIAYKVSWERAADDMVRIAHWCMEHGPPK